MYRGTLSVVVGLVVEFKREKKSFDDEVDGDDVSWDFPNHWSKLIG